MTIKDKPFGLDIPDVLEQLTLEEKVSLLSGKDFWHTASIPRLGVPSIRLSDGPNGLRGTAFYDSTPAACLPCGTALGATFDVDLVRHAGQLLAAEARAKGVHVVLGPTINIQRGPLGGRGFESFSEDPVLSGLLAGHYCKGLEENGIIATPKHFVCNDQEHERKAVNCIVTERALREIYLLPFQLAISLARPRAIMTSYNKVNGRHVAESPDLIQGVLRDEWKWEGLVMSDWFGTYSTSSGVNGGVDLEMPGPGRWRGQALIHAVNSNKVKMSTVDDRVRAVLTAVAHAQQSGVPEDGAEKQLDRPQDRTLLRDLASSSAVLLKNDDSILPLDCSQRVAIIGPNAKIATYCGGGSAYLNAYRAVTPFEGITAASNAQVDFAQGVYAHQFLPLLGDHLRTPEGRHGFLIRTYNEPASIPDRRMLEQRVLHNSNLFFIDYEHPELEATWYAEVEGTFEPEENGIYDFGLCVQGTAELFIDGQSVVRNVEDQRAGSSFLGNGTIEETGSTTLQAGRSYSITIQWGCSKTSKLRKPSTVDFGKGGLRFGGCKRLDPIRAIQEAVKLASKSRQVILFAGLSGEWETEGQDRTSMNLPPFTDELISKVLDANSNTVIVTQSGTPISMPWIYKAKAVLHAWYGGNETGHGIADVLYGKVNPCAKLPLTFPRELRHNPTYLNNRSEGGRILYGEDVYVGYRYYDTMGVKPLFAFGHGLSYTTFAISELALQRSGDVLSVSCRLANVGPVAGAEVIQVYISPEFTPLVKRPHKELKAFAKKYLGSGEAVALDVEVDLVRATSFWEEKEARWCSQAGSYKIMVGTSSDKVVLEKSVRVARTVTWTGL
ncbi:glycoside hydrolase family 3 protein [Aureobasidium subglaciale EXF-2481]|uniref:beta-glucosidase n=1 Tax=Aureobasidium subglaciale (strain EXF-2481) TaxID=1043005 RepID=A0A074Y9E1_AURSE|nr:glycoside hydrolase family 3 protein [Aureobasidium subglaciale EXF-2481]KEQ92584.1 glycoside hydrolase family 3 protein [Aureobasidium subglaciale EXF-2481]